MTKHEDTAFRKSANLYEIYRNILVMDLQFFHVKNCHYILENKVNSVIIQDKTFNYFAA